MRCFLSSLNVQRQKMLQSGDQVGTKEMSERKQLSPPPETLLALFNLSLPFYVCLICGEPDSLKKQEIIQVGQFCSAFHQKQL